MRTAKDKWRSLTDKEVWSVENALSDCYPLPDFMAKVPIPLFPDEEILPSQIKDQHKVPNELYALWVAAIAREQSLDQFIKARSPGDLMRFWHLMEKAHKRVHYSLRAASEDPGEVVTGTYLTLAIYHMGLELVMSKLEPYLLKNMG